MTFYHGTNGPLGSVIDPSKPYKRVHRESVPGLAYFTTDILRARYYARWAVKYFGGTARIYEVKPTGEYFQDLTTIRVPENKQTPYPLQVISEAR